MKRLVGWLSCVVLLGACASACSTEASGANKGNPDDLVTAADDAVADGEISADSASAPTLLGTIADGETKTASFSRRAKYLAWSFTASADQSIELTAAGATSEIDTVLMLYRATASGRPTGRSIAINDDDGDGVGSRIDIPAPRAGNYVVIVRRYDLGTSGTVRVALSLSATGTACGGIAGIRCPTGQFCDFPEATTCGAGDQRGVCRAIPTICTREVAPVCGCDGNTYGNRCGANARGVSTLHDGACEPLCPATGVVCTLECPESGRLPSGAPCRRGSFDPASCACNPPRPCLTVTCAPGYTPNPLTCACDRTECPATGVLCTSDCSASGRTPSGAPCRRGTFNPSTCSCDAPFCGGFAGIACQANEYCDFGGSARCGAADAGGVCRVRPEVCTADYRPVCGCDGRTYSNACGAASAGVSVASNGACGR